MNHAHLWIAATIIALVLIAEFALSVPHTRDITGTPPPAPASSSTPAVTLHDTFRKGVHTIAGSIETPNACSVVSARATVSSGASGTESILVDISTSGSTGLCLELPTRTTFQTTVSAPAHLPLTLSVNGSPATTSAP